MRESQFQRQLIKDLKGMFPGCFILKNDSSYLQGVPDLIVLYNDKWAMLEVKASKDAAQQANQNYYIRKLNAMSFAAFIYPENCEEILDALESAFEPRRTARVSKR